MIHPYCPGTNCPIRENCQHYAISIDTMSDIYFAFTPYNHRLKKCEHFKTGSIIQQIQELVDKKKNKEDNGIA